MVVRAAVLSGPRPDARNEVAGLTAREEGESLGGRCAFGRCLDGAVYGLHTGKAYVYIIAELCIFGSYDRSS